MKILLISRFNVPNLGDLVISDQLYKELATFSEVDKFNLFGSPYKFNDINEISVETSKKKLYRRLMKSNLLGMLKPYFYIKKNLKVNANNLKRKFNEYDLIVLGGGNMLMSNGFGNSTIKKIQRYVEIANESKIPIAMIDIGIGPFKDSNDCEISIQALNRCSFISFRDSASYKFFIDNGGNPRIAKTNYDAVLRKKYLSEKFDKSESNAIAINIIDYNRIGNLENTFEGTNLGYARLIMSILNTRDEKIYLFTTTSEDDEALFEIEKNFSDNPRVEVYKVNGLNDIEKLYEKSTLIIGTRMHSLILAYTMYTPIIGLSWQRKINNLFDLIDDAGSMFKLEDLPVNTNEIVNLIDLKINSLDNEQVKINQNLLKIRRDSLDYRSEFLKSIN